MVSVRGKTSHKTLLGPFDTVTRAACDERETGLSRGYSGRFERQETLRARLIAATVEAVAEGSGPRLTETRDASKTRINTGFLAPSPRAARPASPNANGRSCAADLPVCADGRRVLLVS